MSADHKLRVLVATHDLAKGGGPEEGVNLRRLADHLVHNRRVVQQHHAAFGTKGFDQILYQVGVLDRLLDDVLDRSLSERTEHVTPDPSHQPAERRAPVCAAYPETYVMLRRLFGRLAAERPATVDLISLFLTFTAAQAIGVILLVRLFPGGAT